MKNWQEHAATLEALVRSLNRSSTLGARRQLLNEFGSAVRDARIDLKAEMEAAASSTIPNP